MGVLFLILFSPAVWADEYPSPRGFVNDFAGIIDPGAAARMETMLRQLRDRAGIEIAVVTVQSLNGRPIEDYTIDLARRWGVGGKQEDAGVVVLVAPNERNYRIEVGYGLEGDLPDGLVGEFGRQMIPYFRRQEYGRGILLTVESMVATLAEKRQIQIEGVAARGRTRRGGETEALGFGIFIFFLMLVVIGVILIAAARGGRRGGPPGGWRGGRRRYYQDSDWFLYPIIFGGGGSGGFGGHRGGGSSWGGFGGGGGFGGFGGGSFGGGGASGSW